jgi:hypothetical protein
MPSALADCVVRQAGGDPGDFLRLPPLIDADGNVVTTAEQGTYRTLCMKNSEDATERLVADAIEWARSYHPPSERPAETPACPRSLAAAFGRGVREVEAAERSRARSQLCAPRMGTGTGRGAGMGAVVNAALSAPSCGG